MFGFLVLSWMVIRQKIPSLNAHFRFFVLRLVALMCLVAISLVIVSLIALTVPVYLGRKVMVNISSMQAYRHFWKFIQTFFLNLLLNFFVSFS